MKKTAPLLILASMAFAPAAFSAPAGTLSVHILDQQTGMPHQMLMAIRLWRAKAFLTHGMPAAEVAAATGLTDQSHLTRAFTHRYGITPVRYQKQVTRR